jgi:4-hydroxyphenylpyruvate dioxygenase
MGSPAKNILYIHHVNFYVKDVNLWQKWFEFYLDFKAIADRTTPHTHTKILHQGQIQIHLSQALTSHSHVAQYLQNHPQGIGEIGFAVRRYSSRSHSVSEGNRESLNPNLRLPIVPEWGDILHSFVKENLTSESYPESYPMKDISSSYLFRAIDHIVVNVPEINTVANWYEQNLGLHQGDRFKIQTPNSALSSIVMQSGDRKIQIPINEPTTPNSQIQEFLNYNNGAGVQHLALLTDDITATVAKLKQRGLKFLETTPPILSDRQDSYTEPYTEQTLMQIFTQPIFNEPTFFFEIIQRQNHAQGFGEKNFQALFEAVERQQLIKVSSR